MPKKGTAPRDAERSKPRDEPAPESPPSDEYLSSESSGGGDTAPAAPHRHHAHDKEGAAGAEPSHHAKTPKDKSRKAKPAHTAAAAADQAAPKPADAQPSPGGDGASTASGRKVTPVSGSRAEGETRLPGHDAQWVMRMVASSDDETENTLAMAVREIRRYRERITELEELVRQLGVSYGIDPESLLSQESTPGSSAVLRKGSRGLRVSVGGEPGSDSAGTKEPGAESTTSSTSTSTGASTSDAATAGTAAAAAAATAGPEHGHLSDEQKVQNIMAKLQRLTGRKMSLEEIGPLLHARTADEALRNGRLLRTADHLKRMYGGRPVNYVRVAQGPLPHGAGAEGPGREQRQRLKSRSYVEFGSLKPHDGVGSDGESDRDDAGVAVVTDLELVGESTFGRKIEKLTRLTGRRGSLSEIRSLLLPGSAEEAKQCAQSLYTVEKIKKHYGERPAVERVPQIQQK